MPPEDHGAEVVGLFDVLLGLQHQVEPAGHRHAGCFHQLLAAEAALQVLVVDVPHACPVLPGAGGQSVVGRQGVVQRADVGGALHVVVAAEDVGTAARHADHAHREPENAVGPGVAAAGVVLGGAHAPADGERAVVGQRPCDALHLGTRHAGHPLGLLGVPLGDLRPNLVHTVNTLADVLLVQIGRAHV